MKFYRSQITKKYHVPVRIFTLSDNYQNNDFEKQNSVLQRVDAEGNLEKKVLSIVATLGILSGLFFLSSNITGNVVGNLNQTSSNWIGGILFVIGLIGGYFFVRRKG